MKQIIALIIMIIVASFAILLVGFVIGVNSVIRQHNKEVQELENACRATIAQIQQECTPPDPPEQKGFDL